MVFSAPVTYRCTRCQERVTVELERDADRKTGPCPKNRNGLHTWAPYH